MNPIDLGIIIVYVVGCTALGSWLGRSARGLKGYFLGERDAPTWAIMISIVATETSTVTFLSLPGASYKAGGDLAWLQVAFGYILGRALVARLLLPMYFRGEIYSAYEILGVRFGDRTRRVCSALFLGMRAIADGLRLCLTAVVVQEFSGLPMVWSIAVIGLATMIYTYIGGMKAVIWTDVIQFVVYVLGGFFALALLFRLQGAGAWLDAPEKLRVFHFGFDWTNPLNFWSGLVGGAILSMATHGADQLMVQRYLSARGRPQATAALLASGVVVFAQFGLFLLIGIGLAAHYAGTPDLPPDVAFARFLTSDQMPVGVRGLILAALFAAAMSTLSSSLNASASATMADFLIPRLRNSPEERLVRMSRRLIFVWGLIQMGIAASALRTERQIIDQVLAVASLTAGLLLGMFLLALWAPRAGERAALTGLVVAGTLVVTLKLLSPLAWTWYALVGGSATLAAGAIASRILGPERDPASSPTHSDPGGDPGGGPAPNTNTNTNTTSTSITTTNLDPDGKPSP